MKKLNNTAIILGIVTTFILSLCCCNINYHHTIRVNRKMDLRANKIIAFIPSRDPQLNKLLYNYIENSNRITILTNTQFDSLLVRVNISIADIMEDRHVLAGQLSGVDAIVLIGSGGKSDYWSSLYQLEVINAHTGRQMLDEDIAHDCDCMQDVLKIALSDILGQGDEDVERYK